MSLTWTFGFAFSKALMSTVLGSGLLEVIGLASQVMVPETDPAGATVVVGPLATVVLLPLPLLLRLPPPELLEEPQPESDSAVATAVTTAAAWKPRRLLLMDVARTADAMVLIVFR